MGRGVREVQRTPLQHDKQIDAALAICSDSDMDILFLYRNMSFACLGLQVSKDKKRWGSRCHQICFPMKRPNASRTLDT
jgi:hypothetical protein